MGRCCTRCHPRLFLRSLFETKAVVANGPPPTSVRAYKSRQSRIPRGRLIALELSRGGVDEASAPGETGPPNVSRVGRRQGVTRRIGTMKGWSVYLGGGRGLVQSGDPTCKWCAFIVSKELRMNM